MAMTTPEARRRRQHIAITILILGFSITTVLLAIQVLLSQQNAERANEDRDRAIFCQKVYASQIEQWVNGSPTREGTLDALRKARESSQAVRDADEAWHHAVDGVFQLIVESVALPEGEEIPEERVNRVLAKYQEARTALFEAYGDAATVQQTTPLPELDLNCSKEP